MRGLEALHLDWTHASHAEFGPPKKARDYREQFGTGPIGTNSLSILEGQERGTHSFPAKRDALPDFLMIEAG